MTKPSPLHQRTVALLWGEISVALRRSEPLYMNKPDGTKSGNLIEGSKEVYIPDDLTHVGGVIPDLALRGDDGRPNRIIEVIVTSPPDAVKRKKLDTLQSRGIDVVEVNVKNEDDLFALFAPLPLDIRFAPRGSKFSRSVEAMGGSQSNSDHKIREVMTALVRCSPEVRREFCQLLQSIGSLDSFHPISRDNPVLGTNADGNG